jgi:polyphosphate kinase
VVRLLEKAARDPKVLAIKATLYRTGAGSPMTDALLEAARNGKEVTAIVELRARFDEEANIHTALRLQEAGAKVAYGIVGYKAHAKMILIVRKEPGGLRRYVHLGTGNYHLRNAESYTDFGLLSADETLGRDVHHVFQQLTGLGEARDLRKLVQSPFSLHERVLEWIETEIANAQAGKRAFVRARMNALIDPHVIRALYRASQAGVEVDLIVRGICCLRPGVKGVSERIRVRSVIGRFLEHSRVYHFAAGGEDRVWCSSADWMPRNFFRRVEVAFPVEEPALKRRVIEEGIDRYLEDDAGAWELKSDGTYARAPRRDGPPREAQRLLLEALALRA